LLVVLTRPELRASVWIGSLLFLKILGSELAFCSFIGEFAANRVDWEGSCPSSLYNLLIIVCSQFRVFSGSWASALTSTYWKSCGLHLFGNIVIIFSTIGAGNGWRE